MCVSIHAPWEGCDDYEVVVDLCKVTFQFTHPGKGATPSRRGDARLPHVSIHAPWEGCDYRPLRPPDASRRFQFTHPGKGATIIGKTKREVKRVSIHAPWEGCDANTKYYILYTPSFNSRTLGRVRPSLEAILAKLLCFNSRTLGRVRRPAGSLRACG